MPSRKGEGVVDTLVLILIPLIAFMTLVIVIITLNRPSIDAMNESACEASVAAKAQSSFEIAPAGINVLRAAPGPFLCRTQLKKLGGESKVSLIKPTRNDAAILDQSKLDTAEYMKKCWK